MGFLKKIGKGVLITGAVAGVSALVIRNRIKEKEEEEEEEEKYEKWEREREERETEIQRRKSMICEFDDVITEDVFEAIVYKCAKRIKRINRN